MRPERMSRRIALALGTALLMSAATPSAAQPSPRTNFPSLQLIVTESAIEQIRSPESEFVIIDELPGFVAAVGGAFEIQVNRLDDGSTSVQQVTRLADGSIGERRRLPRWTVADWTQGLDAFFRVRVTDASGTEIHAAAIPFCPLSAERFRIDDTGPPLPTYPYGCSETELTVGMAWGIDTGWSSRAPDSIFVGTDVPDGTYRLDIEISRRYRDLFRIPADRARASLSVEIVTGVIDGPVGDPAGTERSVGDIHGLPAQTALPPSVSPDASGLPDLIALPPFNIFMAGPDDPGSEGVDAIIFAANVWNGGDGPLVVEGFRQPGEAVMDAYQYLYENGSIVGKELVGELEYDPIEGHRHWHFRDFAQYRIIDDAGNEVAVSGKEAFCLMPTDPVDLTIPNAEWRVWDSGLATSCGSFGAIWIREILQVGWGDTYYQGVPGQWIEIADVPNGEYLLEVATNTDGRLAELRDDNNVATTRILLGGEPGARTVEVVNG